MKERPIFKNKNKNSFDDIFTSKNDELDKEDVDELDIYDSSIKEYDESEDEDLAILDNLINGNYKKVKKDRKKKEKKEKKKQKKDKKKEKKKQKKKEDELLDLDEVYTLDDKKINRKKLSRDDEEFYESRFNGSLTILRELLKQVNKQVVTAENLQEHFKNSKARGSLTALSNQGANISSLLSTKLNVIKEISNINKTVSDLELKKAKEMKDRNDSNAVNNDVIINEIFRGIVNDEIDVSNVRGEDPDDGEETKSKKKKKNKKKQKKKELSSDDMYSIISNDENERVEVREIDTDDDDDSFDDEDDFDYEEYEDLDSDEALEARLKYLEDNGEIEFSSSEKAYKYEDDVEVIIVKNPRTERWNFMAIDHNGDEIYDYPLPKKQKNNTMTFDREHGIAKDKLNNVYKVKYYDNQDEFYED